MSAAPPVAGKPAGRRWLRGCLVWLVIGLAVVGACVWRLGEPARRAAAAHAALHLGMTLRDVLAASGDWFTLNGGTCGSKTGELAFYSILNTSGHARVVLSKYVVVPPPGQAGSYEEENLRFDDRASLAAGLSSRPDVAACRELGITYLVPGVPPRTTFRVFFGPDGRVERLSDPRTWD
jgi:hypothetical protein